jgi:hypothetical protein
MAPPVALRHLPARLDPTERLRLEATVFAADALLFAFSSIREITARHSSGISSIPRHERTALFAHAWTMVDQIHVLRQLLHAMRNGQMGPNQKKFYDTSEPATKIRNRMDHLNATIPSRASPAPPLHRLRNPFRLSRVPSKTTGDLRHDDRKNYTFDARRTSVKGLEDETPARPRIELPKAIESDSLSVGEAAIRRMQDRGRCRGCRAVASVEQQSGRCCRLSCQTPTGGQRHEQR